MTVLRELDPSAGLAGAPPASGRIRGAVRRHPVLSVVLLAFGVRAALAVIVAVTSGGSLFEDDGTYPLLAAQHASGHTQSWGEYEYFLFDATSTLLLPLSWLYRLFGYSVLIGQLLVAAFASVAAGAVTRLALESLERRWALCAGCVVALLPSQVLFSSTVFKDAAVWASLALLALVVALLGRVDGWRSLCLVGAAAALYLLLAHLRLHTLVVAVWAAALAVLVMPGRGRVLQRVAMLVLALWVPFALGLGAGGFHFVTNSSATLEQRRLGNASGASTAFVHPKPALPKPAASPGGSGAPSVVEATPSPSGQPAAPAVTAEPDAAGGRDPRALARGLSVMLFEPYPRPSTFANRNVTFALVENLVWWPLLVLAFVGAWQAKRERRVLGFPLLVGGAIVLLYALSEGNFGTAYRHRGEIVWVVALLAAFGARSLWERRGRRNVT